MEAVVETDEGDEEAGEEVTKNVCDKKAEEGLDKAAFNDICLLDSDFSSGGDPGQSKILEVRAGNFM